MLVYQRVNLHFPMVFLWLTYIPISIANMGWTTKDDIRAPFIPRNLTHVKCGSSPGAENAFGLLGWLRRSIPSIPFFRGLTSIFMISGGFTHHQISIARNSWVFPWVLWKSWISWVFPRPQLPSASVSSCGTGAEAVDFLGEKQRDLTEQNFEFNRSEDLNWFNYIVSWLVVWKKDGRSMKIQHGIIYTMVYISYTI